MTVTRCPFPGEDTRQFMMTGPARFIESCESLVDEKDVHRSTVLGKINSDLKETVPRQIHRQRTTRLVPSDHRLGRYHPACRVILTFPMSCVRRHARGLLRLFKRGSSLSWSPNPGGILSTMLLLPLPGPIAIPSLGAASAGGKSRICWSAFLASCSSSINHYLLDQESLSAGGQYPGIYIHACVQSDVESQPLFSSADETRQRPIKIKESSLPGSSARARSQ